MDGEENPLVSLSNALIRASQTRKEDNEKRRNEATDAELPCKYAHYEKIIDSFKVLLIQCLKTNKACVCSYYSQHNDGSVMNGNYENCPGFGAKE